jgi:ABC-type transport system involved in multi-copper enzyme maturation permease subunit
MGLAFDNACILWQPLTCGDASGSCAFYDNKALSVNFLILILAVKCVSLIAMIFAVVVYRPPVSAAAVDTMEVKVSTDINDEKTQQNQNTTRSISEEASQQIDGKINCGFVQDESTVTEVSQM